MKNTAIAICVIGLILAIIITVLVITGEKTLQTGGDGQDQDAPMPERITVKNNEVVVEYSDGTRIKEYVPPEGKVEIVLGKKEVDAPAQTEPSPEVRELSSEFVSADSITAPAVPGVRIIRYAPEINIRTRGFTARPFVGAGYNGKFSPVLGVKLVYLGKIGLGLATTDKEFGLAATYHLQSWMSIVHNLELAVVAGKQYEENSPGVFVGLATTF